MKLLERKELIKFETINDKEIVSLTNKGLNASLYNNNNTLIKKITDVSLFKNLNKMHPLEVKDLFYRFDVFCLNNMENFLYIFECFKNGFNSESSYKEYFSILLSKSPSKLITVLEMNSILEDGDLSLCINKIIDKIKMTEDGLCG